MIGEYPTKVHKLDGLSSARTDLWIKRDDLTHSVYGGNKVRKLEALLEDAQSKGARRLLTIGAVGSHHVLATVIHGAQAGFRVAAVLSPQPWSREAQDDLEAGLANGLEAFAASSMVRIPWIVAKTLKRGDYFIPPGGSNVLGAMGYARAVKELAEQIRKGQVPEPDLIVVALGSGGTVAGLIEGLEEVGLRSKVQAVRVVPSPLVTRASTLALAWALSKHRKTSTTLSRLSKRLLIDDEQLGRGYGYETAEGAEASVAADALGICLDQTYTAKAFASALSLVRNGTSRNILYWHTLSSRGAKSLLAGHGARPEISPSLRALFMR